MTKSSKITIIILSILLVASILLNLGLGFIALDRTIRVNELLGGNDGP
ncbi:MAG: hypothetical protein ABI721_04385 [Candidatus Dojkabacteria bacterium]